MWKSSSSTVTCEESKLMSSSAMSDTYGSDQGPDGENGTRSTLSSPSSSIANDEEQQQVASEEAAAFQSSSSSSIILTTTTTTTFPIEVVAMSILLGLVSGTLYGFGRYALALKQVLGLSQQQVQTFGICLDCGNYIGHPITGWIYDRYGPSISCILAACIVAASYGTIHLIMVIETQRRRYDDHDELEGSDVLSASSSWGRLAMLNLAFVGVGLGSGLCYIAGLGSTTKYMLASHPNYLNRAVGLVAAGYGLSSVLVGLSYRWLHLTHFFLFWAMVVPVVALGAAYLFRHSDSATTTTMVVVVDEEEQQQEDNDDDDDALEDDDMGRPLLVSTRPSLEGPSMEDDDESILHPETTIRGSGGGCVWDSWKRIEFWLLFIAFACVTGCGLFVINNVSTMVESIRLSDELSFGLIIALSLSNVAGRLGMGSLGDVSSSSTSTTTTSPFEVNGTEERKLRLLQMTHVIMAIAFLNVLLTDQKAISLVLLVVIVALAYGGSWVAVVSVLSDLFGRGKNNFGKDYGLLAMGPALSGMALNKLSAKWYDEQTTTTTDNNNNNVCLGDSCYRKAYIVAVVAAILGLVSMEILIWKRRRRQQQQQEATVS